MSETGRGEISPQRPPSKIQAVWEMIRHFGKKPEITTPSQATPVISIEPTTTPELPEAVSEDPVPSTLATEPDTREPEQTEEAESTQQVVENQERQLRPANRIFFHGTRLRNFSDIRDHGLYADKDYDVVGRDLFESLYMELEYGGPAAIHRSPFNMAQLNEMDNLPREERERIREEANRFVLSIWDDSAHLQKTTDQWWKNRTGQYGLTEELEEPIPTPQTARIRLGDTLTPEEHVHLPAEDLLAGIPITQDLKDLLIAAQLNFLTNRKTADQIETELSSFFSQPGNVVITREGYTDTDLSHDLLSRIQQQVVLFKDGFLVRRAEQRRTEGDNRQLAWDLSLKLRAVNDPISQEYLKRLAQRLYKAVEQRGAINHVYTEQGEVRPPIGRQNFVAGGYLLTDAWGTTPREDIKRVARQMGLTH